MICRAQIAFSIDSTLPRDQVTITPHYNGVDNPQALADKLKANLIAIPTIAATVPFTVKIYDAEKPPPSYPLASAQQTGTPKTRMNPGEVALCLSYYSGRNIPRQRGRIYVPYDLITGSLGKRPTTAQMNEVLNTWGAAIAKNITAPVRFCVWSRFLKQSFSVDNLWVDDEWDTVRSRGLRATTRVTTTVP